MVYHTKQVAQLKGTLHACALLTLLSGTTLAGTMGEASPTKTWMQNLYLGIDGGYSLSLNSTDFTPYNGANVATPGVLFFVPGNTTFQRDIDNSGMIGAFLGYRVSDSLSFNLNYDYRGGFGWQVPTNADVAAGVNDLVYFVKDIQIQTLFVNFVINPNKNWDGWGNLMPYVTGGLGASFNNVGILRSVDLADPSNYSNIIGASVSSFAWNVGLGVDYALFKNVHYTLGYRFVDAGTVQTSGNLETPEGNILVNPFKANHVLLNEVITGLKWQFDA